MKRNPSIDLFRAVLMCGIILLHLVSLPCYWMRWSHLAYLLLPCVDGFILISGYFGVKLTIRKLLSLYVTALWCVLLSIGSHHLIWGVPDSFVSAFVKDSIFVFKGCWFLHAYAFLMLFAPMVNFVLEEKDPSMKFKILMPVLLVIFGWGLGTHFAGIHHYVPPMPGLTQKSGLTLLGIYIIGRFYRQYETVFDRIALWKYFLVVVVFGFVCSIGQGWFGAYNSPVAVVYALSVFHLFKSFHCPACLGRIAIWLSPSVFSVYILHANRFQYENFKYIVELLLDCGISQIVSFVVVVVCVFGAAIILDSVRRLTIKVWMSS